MRGPLSFILSVVVAFAVGVSLFSAAPPAPTQAPLPSSPPPEPVQAPLPPPPLRLRIAAVGDVLLHGSLQKQAAAHPERAKSLWAQTIPWLQGADVAYANLEGPVAPGLAVGGRRYPDPGPVFDGRVYTSYPLFNYPTALLDALVDSGIDVVSTANNHALDRGSEGVDKTIDELERRNLAFVGTRRRTDPAQWVSYTLVRGARFAWIACTYDTNGVPDPHRQVLGCYRDKEELLSLVRASAADRTIAAVVVTPHWGQEYMSAPAERERQLAEDLVSAGALLVLGSHPHVPQPWSILKNSAGAPALVIYSLGNFVSGQFHRVNTRASLVLLVDIEVPYQEKARLVQVGYVPLEMRRTASGYAVEPVMDGRGTPAIERHLVDQFGSWETPQVPE